MLEFDPKKLKALRLQRGWSIDEAARRYELSYPMTCKMEGRLVRPSVATLARIASALKVPVGDLFSEVEIAAPAVPSDLGPEADAWIAKTLKTAPKMTDEIARRVSAALFGKAS